MPLILGVAILARAADAQHLNFPLTPSSADQAQASFDERAMAVIQYNACGREIDYARYRKEMSEENYEHQGEPLAELLISKMAWLRDPRFSGRACEHVLEVARPRKADGTLVHPTIEAFVSAVLGAWNETTTPTRCSFDTSQVDATEGNVTVRFLVTAACLRQQINEAIRAMDKDAQMGTPIPCAFESAFDQPLPDFQMQGDFDVVVRGAVRLLYMDRGARFPVLEPATITHLYEHVLAARGPPSDQEYSVLTGCEDAAGDELGTPEDYADRSQWYNDLLSSITDPLDWLHDFLARITGGALHSGAALAGWPLLVLLGEDPTESMIPHYDVRVPETENHRLMIESSRYLTNAAIIEELERTEHDEVDEVRSDQIKVREWLLKTLQHIAINDFDEYNSKPYQRYSVTALLNLYDFAPDPAMRTASQIVLDRSEAKFAASANRGRRVVPFRRLADSESPDLYNFGGGADHMVVRAPVMAGQIQLLGDQIDRNVSGSMVYAGVSGYRLPRAVLETAIERTATFSQEVRHDALEAYYQSPAFTMSIGGVRIAAAQDFYGIERGVDRGATTPTVLIPTIGSYNIGELFRFDGVGTQDKRTDNQCGWKGFICGIAPGFAVNFTACQPPSTGDPAFIFVNSARCFGGTHPGPHFYLAARTFRCTAVICGADQTSLSYGVMEMVEAPTARPDPDPTFDAFVTARRTALMAATPDAEGFGLYRSSTGEVISYSISPQGAGVGSVDEVSRTITTTRGAILNINGRQLTINSPVSAARVEIDVSDWNNPIRIAVP